MNEAALQEEADLPSLSVTLQDEVLKAPDARGLEQLLQRLPLVQAVVILSPHG